MNHYGIIQSDNSSQHHLTQFDTNLTNKNQNLSNPLAQIIHVIKWYITKATDLWQF